MTMFSNNLLNTLKTIARALTRWKKTFRLSINTFKTNFKKDFKQPFRSGGPVGTAASTKQTTETTTRSTKPPGPQQSKTVWSVVSRPVDSYRTLPPHKAIKNRAKRSKNYESVSKTTNTHGKTTQA